MSQRLFGMSPGRAALSAFGAIWVPALFVGVYLLFGWGGLIYLIPAFFAVLLLAVVGGSWLNYFKHERHMPPPRGIDGK
ncbi:MAG TPA: hypothetical protein VLI07_18755 [Candidatus Binatus sp.]|nr:hypothetical protein [Candidatus Binatus sp.]